MKHLSLECIRVPQFHCTVFRIKEQTHRRADFGETGHTFSSEGLPTLVSMRFPDSSSRPLDELHVRGSKGELDHNCMVLDDADFERVAAAVRQYNKTFGEPEPPILPGDVFVVE